MKYSEKYDRYVDDDLIIYRWDKKKDKLMQCKIHKDKKTGYLRVQTKLGDSLVHRVIYETMIGEISEGMTIDHINTKKTDNRLENLRVVTQKENCNNPLTIKHHSESKIGNTNHRGKTCSEFGKKFFEHFGITNYQNPKLYQKEYMWYYNHNRKCRWES